MTIKIKVTNFLTNEVEIENEIQVTSTMETVKNNHEVFRGAYPDSQVDFIIDDDNFIISPPLNMMKDEALVDQGLMSESVYSKKWYGIDLQDTEEDDFLYRDAFAL
jgi:hypothetical protein